MSNTSRKSILDQVKDIESLLANMNVPTNLLSKNKQEEAPIIMSENNPITSDKQLEESVEHLDDVLSKNTISKIYTPPEMKEGSDEQNDSDPLESKSEQDENEKLEAQVSPTDTIQELRPEFLDDSNSEYIKDAELKPETNIVNIEDAELEPETNIVNIEDTKDSKVESELKEEEELEDNLQGTITFEFINDEGEVGRVIILANGQIEYQGNYTPSEAAQKFWEALQQHVLEQKQEDSKIATTPEINHSELINLLKQDRVIITNLISEKEELEKILDTIKKSTNAELAEELQQLRMARHELQQENAALEYALQESQKDLNNNNERLVQYREIIDNIYQSLVPILKTTSAKNL